MKSLFRIYKVTVWKQNTRAPRVAAALAAILFATSPALAKDQVPFRGSFVTTFSFAPISFDPPLLTGNVHVDGVGQVLHLGRTTMNDDFVSVINVVTGDGTLGSGTLRWIAANGDELHGSLTGTSTTIGPGLIAFTGTFSFSGGTGRFRDATAEANFVGGAQFTDPDDPSQGGTGFVSFSGTLSRRN